jgi:hypothetical protein
VATSLKNCEKESGQVERRTESQWIFPNGSSEKPEDGTFRDGKRDVIHGCEMAEAFG